MPPRKPPAIADKRIVLQLYNCGTDQLVALYIDEIFVTYNSTVRIKIPEYEDPVFLCLQDDRILYKQITYSDFSVSSIGEAREWLEKSGIPITPFDPGQIVE